MGFPKKAQTDSGLESEGKKWVIAGISIKTTLNPVNTKPKVKKNSYKEVDEIEEEEEQISTTPTAKESRIPEKLPCPPAPRKRRPSRCNYNSGGVREFFTHPDLETVFKCYIEKAN